MAKVYRVGSYHGTEYVSTLRDADRTKPGGEEPESVERVDAATECNALIESFDEEERRGNVARRLLEEVFDSRIVTQKLLAKIDAYFAANPMPPADAADRDGQRSYGI
jgi:hypothetical protein